ncbi:hypothetical protein E3P91_00165 [Wallemia ichthyophaga]|nr:hypothetical protein E3P91_00165 [Wallemia ichthyophaga]TIB61932.1 hypothetical protein E3P78_02565 [Wallemia ichthyophaga]
MRIRVILSLISILSLFKSNNSLDAPDFSLGNSPAECLISSNTTVLTPGHELYDTARQTWNSRTVFSPQFIVRPSKIEEVQHSVICGTHYGLPVTTKSGGHGYSGYAIGDITIDMANMKSISIEDNGLVHAETGNHLFDLYQTIYEQRHLSLPGGICPQVGVGGHTAFGGHGPLSRKLGLLVDRVVEAEVVFANGTVSNVTEGEDMFFAVTGAAPSFASVTRFTYDAVEAPTNTVIFSYSLNNRTAEESANAFNSFQTFMNHSELTNDFNAQLTLGPGSFELSGTFFGDEEIYQNISKPLLDSLKLEDGDKEEVFSVTEFIDMYKQIYGDFSPVAEPKSFYSKSLMEDQPLALKDLQSFFEYLFNNATKANQEGIGWYIIVEAYNGAVHDTSANTRSFAHRDTLLTFQFFAEIANDEDELFELVDGMLDSITLTPKAAYPNYVDPRLDNWQYLYYGDNYARLRRIKGEIDPKNTFRFPQSGL